jgi:hypothetical protein
MKLIYGSAAVKHWFPEFRIPNDLDFISSENHWIPLENSYWIDAFEYLENNKHPMYVDPNFLLTIKVSHACYDIHWDKTLKDIIFLLNKGCVLDKTFYNLLIKDWSIIHGKKKVNLNVPNEEFFRNNITRKYSHDELHEHLAFYSKPLHNYIRINLNYPMSSEDMFYELSKEDQIKCMLEETFVFMFERFLIPKKTKSLKHAKYLALKQLITSSTSGWFNLALIMNFEELINYDADFLKPKLEELK